MRFPLARPRPPHVTSSVYAAEQQSRERRPLPMQRREVAAQACLASLFLVAAGLLARLRARGATCNVTDLVLLVLAAAVLGRLDFEAGPATRCRPS